MARLKKTDLAYIAGLIDGEGCLSANRKKDCIATNLSVVNTNRPVIEFLQRYCGGGIYRRHPLGRRVVWTWWLSSNPATQLLRQLLPYLQIKREQAQWFIELSELKAIRRGIENGGRYAPERQDELLSLIKQDKQREWK